MSLFMLKYGNVDVQDIMERVKYLENELQKEKDKNCKLQKELSIVKNDNAE